MSNTRGFTKDVEETRTINFVFSDETRDSFGTVFTAKDWVLDRFDKNGIALFNHNSYSNDPDMAIGTARAWVQGKELLGSITFEPAEINPIADKVFRKYLAGTYKGVSIRFNPLEMGHWGEGDESAEGKNPTYYFGKRELIEISSVPLPSNKNALVRSIGDEMAAKNPDCEGFFIDGHIRSIDPSDTDEEGGKEETKTENDIPDESYTRCLTNAYKALGSL